MPRACDHLKKQRASGHTYRQTHPTAPGQGCLQLLLFLCQLHLELCDLCLQVSDLLMEVTGVTLQFPLQLLQFLPALLLFLEPHCSRARATSVGGWHQEEACASLPGLWALHLQPKTMSSLGKCTFPIRVCCTWCRAQTVSFPG